MKKNEVFDQHYRDYLKKLEEIDFNKIYDKLGAEYNGKELTIELLNEKYTVSYDAVRDSSGNTPSYDICIILFKYILMCPEKEPVEKEWINFRNFKDAGPLISYFSNNVERKISDHFSGKRENLKKAVSALKGSKPENELNYDLKAQFDFLPKMPLLLLFNDEDEEFPASTTVLFEKCAETYLDAECLAMVGFKLAYELIKNS